MFTCQKDNERFEVILIYSLFGVRHETQEKYSEYSGMIEKAHLSDGMQFTNGESSCAFSHWTETKETK